MTSIDEALPVTDEDHTQFDQVKTFGALLYLAFT